MTTTTTSIEVLALDDPRAADPSVAGAKVAGLAWLHANSFPVPNCFVLPVGIAQAWPDGPAPDDVRRSVAQICQELHGPMAVRTSATWEDGATSAHAGATTTVLGVEDVDDTLDAIRRCLDESARAGKELGTSGDMAIALQRLVPADWAGVAFSADPITGERDVVRIAATAGLGEKLVQGDVVGVDVTVRGDTVEGELAGFPIETALEVAGRALEVEGALGRPQDIEWAVANGELWLVQARPITALPVEPALPDGNNWQKDTAHYPEPLTPFGWSLMHACGDEIRSAFDEMGLLIRGLDERFVGGEIYGRVLPAFGSPDDARKPPPAIVLGAAARLVPALRSRHAAARRAVELDLPGRWVRDWHRSDRATMTARSAELWAIDLRSLDDDELVGHLDKALALARDGQRIHFRLLMPLAQRLFDLHRMVSEELGWDDPTIASMLQGHSPASRASAEAVEAIGRRIRGTEGAVEALESQPGRPVSALAEVDSSLARQLEEWIDEHGWALFNYDAGVPVLAERPTMITKLLLSDPAPADHSAADELVERARRALPKEKRSAFDSVLSAAREVYALREDNTIVVGDRPMALVRRVMLEAGDRLAEARLLPSAADVAYLFIDELRQAMAGSPDPDTDLVDRIVQRRGEEAWARAHPGPAYLGEQAPPPDTSRLPSALRRVNEPILWMVSHEYPSPREASESEDVLVQGVGSSPGTAVGPARIVRGQDDMHRLGDGDVLVCQVTSPAWSPLFSLASAVVADGGGALSHAAIAAREHGIPAVLGTGHATTTLTDGQLVRVDGTRGLVTPVPVD